MPKIVAAEPIDLGELKKRIVEEIKKQHSMSVGEFSRSGIPEKYHIDGKNLPVYLSETGSTSFDNLLKLCKLLGLGKLRRQVFVRRTIEYYL